MQKVGVVGMEGIEVKTEGSWTWVSGNTYEIKEALKAQGLKWSPRRKAWYSKRIVDVQIEHKEVKEPNGGQKEKTTAFDVVIKKPRSEKEVLAEGKITNLSKKEYERIAHLFKFSETSYMIEIDANDNWGTATKRKLYKTEKAARKVFDKFNVEPLEPESKKDTEYEKTVKELKERFGMLSPM